MNITLNDENYAVETVAYLKVFYPLEIITVNTDEQPTLQIAIHLSYIEVAYFDGQTVALMPEDCVLYQEAVGKEKLSIGKRLLKTLLYELLRKITGITPPWGILIGIRPTKLTSRLLERYKNEDRVKEELKHVYKVSEEKVCMLMDVVAVEKKYMDQPMNKHSVYIGVPFCPSKCAYCSFTSYSKDRFPKAYKAYTNQLIDEMESFRDSFKYLRSIYIGGGTPTSLTEEDFETLLKRTRALIGDQTIEFTVEAGRPDSITANKLLAMKQYGVNRISINPQTSHDKTLERIGRAHSYSEVERVFFEARHMGFDHINMDLILGLPGETVEDVKITIDRIIRLDPESITVHTLALKRGTRLSEDKRDYLNGMYETITAMLDETQKALRNAGYGAYYLYRQKNMVGHFENVGYAKRNKECVYNIHTMEEKESIIAFGAGAISKKVIGKKVERLDQPKDVRTYLAHLPEIVKKKQLFFYQ